MGLTLSEEKTLVTPVTRPFRFLGHKVFVAQHRGKRKPVSTTRIPKERGKALRHQIKAIFHRNTTNRDLKSRLKALNMLIRGWGNFYRHAWGASRVFSFIDSYIWFTILRWLKRKHRNTPFRKLKALYARREPGWKCGSWKHEEQSLFLLRTLKVEYYRMARQSTPAFANVSGEPGA